MNNAICILIDSVVWDCFGNKRIKESPTPFLDSLKKESLIAESLFSQGPYTDAATKSLYTGRNCLDDFGYFFKLNSSRYTHFDAFHDNGFETYGFYYPYYLYGPNIKKSIDHTIYTSGFLYDSEWGGIFDYYAKIVNQRDLSSLEIDLLIKRINLMFDSWISFYNDILVNDESRMLIEKEMSNFDLLIALKKLTNEREKFNTNKVEYIHSILNGGKEHELAKIDFIDVDALINRDYLKKEVFRKYRKIFKKISINNFVANSLHNKPNIKRVIYSIKNYIKTKEKNNLRFLSNFYHCINSTKEFISNSNLKRWQNMPSARRQLDTAFSILKNRKSKIPFYLSLHLLDPHEYISFFSYDIQNNNIMKEEFEMINKYINSCGTCFKGSLPYILTIRYVDFCIEKFCEKLKEIGLWENTSLLIVADHGSSYSYYPLHGIPVNCFDEECYHIPMMIRNPNSEMRKVEKYFSSMDVFPTFFDILGIKKPDSFIGKSMLVDSGLDYIITEYMGSGCPDMLSKKIWFSIRDKNYCIGLKVPINNTFEKREINEVYDIKKDKNCFYNLKDKLDVSSYDYLLSKIESRFYEIKEDVCSFISGVKNEHRK